MSPGARSAYIRVSKTGYCTVTDEMGRWSLSAPTGEYDIVFWHERLGELRHEVVLPEGGGRFDVEYTLGDD